MSVLTSRTARVGIGLGTAVLLLTTACGGATVNDTGGGGGGAASTTAPHVGARIRGRLGGLEFRGVVELLGCR